MDSTGISVEQQLLPFLATPMLLIPLLQLVKPFTKLNAGEGDVLWRNTTITFSRDVSVKLRFLGVNYYDGQGFMVNKSLGVSSAKELDGASVCIQTGTTTELNLADYFSSNNMSYEAVTIETNDEARQNYEAGRCDIYTTDASGLASTRSSLPNPNDHMVLPEIISKEPLGPAVRQGDDAWADIITWVLAATITAEELGVNSSNVDQMKNSNNPEIRECLEPMEAKVQNLDFQMIGLTRSLNRLEITAKFLKEILESILHLELHVG